MSKSVLDTIVQDSLRKVDVGYMIADLKEIFAKDEDAFKDLVEVLKESLGEFLMDIYASTEENVTLETLLCRLGKIINRRIDEEDQLNVS